MNRTLLAIVGVIAFLSAAPSSSAFTTHPVDLSPPASDTPADPAQLSDKTPNGQSGGTTLRLPEGLRFQFTAPSIEQQHERPVCHVPKYGIRAERTQVTRCRRASGTGNSGKHRRLLDGSLILEPSVPSAVLVIKAAG